jgi:hypothetical protein
MRGSASVGAAEGVTCCMRDSKRRLATMMMKRLDAEINMRLHVEAG